MQSHASLYQLTIEKGTPFYALYQKKAFHIPDESLAADMYDLTNSLLASKGLEAYEISNYAKQGHECIHNLNYWHYGDYIGIGPGAHGRITDGATKKATTTIHHPENWLLHVQEKNHGIQSEILLSQMEMLEEILMFGLRLKTGIQLNRADEILNTSLLSLLNKKQLSLLQKEDLLIIDESELKLSDKGRLLTNSVINALLQQ
jgi:oxygen-independent coproporphyrinogen-3 oxidase